jgi:hypothetical protein
VRYPDTKALWTAFLECIGSRDLVLSGEETSQTSFDTSLPKPSTSLSRTLLKHFFPKADPKKEFGKFFFD